MLPLVEMMMFGWDFEVDVWSRFWRLSFIKIFVWTCFNFGKLNSTLGSVVSLAMFFTYSSQFIIAALGDDGDRDGDDKKKENMDMWMHHRSDVAMLLEGEGFIKRCTYTMLQKISIQNPLCQFCFYITGQIYGCEKSLFLVANWLQMGEAKASPWRLKGCLKFGNLWSKLWLGPLQWV